MATPVPGRPTPRVLVWQDFAAPDARLREISMPKCAKRHTVTVSQVAQDGIVKIATTSGRARELDRPGFSTSGGSAVSRRRRSKSATALARPVLAGGHGSDRRQRLRQGDRAQRTEAPAAERHEHLANWGGGPRRALHAPGGSAAGAGGSRPLCPGLGNGRPAAP